MMVATIESVIAQEFESWELVIVDDGSTDASSAVAVRLASRDDRIIAASFPNGGVATARNRGFALTDAGKEFVAFLDSDDVWFPDTLRVLVAALDRHPRHVAAHGLPVCIDSEGRRVLGDDSGRSSVDGWPGRRVAPFRSMRPRRPNSDRSCSRTGAFPPARASFGATRSSGSVRSIVRSRRPTTGT